MATLAQFNKLKAHVKNIDLLQGKLAGEVLEVMETQDRIKHLENVLTETVGTMDGNTHKIKAEMDIYDKRLEGVELNSVHARIDRQTQSIDRLSDTIFGACIVLILGGLLLWASSLYVPKVAGYQPNLTQFFRGD